MRGADELHAALGDRARRGRLELGADLVDDDDLGHVVLDRLDHHRVLLVGRAHLHAPRAADARVRDVAVAGDLVGRVDDDDALVELVGQHARGLAQHRRLADARPAHDQDALARLDQVLDDLDRAEHGAADAAGQADDLAAAIADGADAVQRALDAGAVVVAERADVVDDVLDVLLGHLALEQHLLAAAAEARLGRAAEVHDDLDQVALGRQRAQIASPISGGSAIEQRLEVVGAFGWCRSGRSSFVVSVIVGCISRGRGTSAGSSTRTALSFISSETLGDAVEALLLEAPIERRLVGAHRADHAALGRLRRSRARPSRTRRVRDDRQAVMRSGRLGRAPAG